MKGWWFLLILLAGCAQPEAQPAATPPVETPPVEVLPTDMPAPAQQAPTIREQIMQTQYKGAVFEDVDAAPGNVYVIRGELLQESVSLLYIRAITLEASIVAHNASQNYTTMRLIYTQGGEEICNATGTKQFIGPVANYRLANPAAKDNPYLRQYWSNMVFACNESVPEVNR